MSSSLSYTPFQPLVNPKEYENLAIILLIIGFIMTSYFFIYQITNKKQFRSLTREVVVALFSSVFLALGTFFLFLAVGFHL